MFWICGISHFFCTFCRCGWISGQLCYHVDVWPQMCVHMCTSFVLTWIEEYGCDVQGSVSASVKNCLTAKEKSSTLQCCTSVITCVRVHKTQVNLNTPPRPPSDVSLIYTLDANGKLIRGPSSRSLAMIFPSSSTCPLGSASHPAACNQR